MISIPTDSIENSSTLLKVAKELYELYNQKQEELPYRLNVISELHANENANSRILRGLLAYSSNGKFPIFESFIKMLQSNLQFDLDIDISSAEFTNQDNEIDLLIKKNNDYAIIIENKIWNAVDQVTQIQRYVEYAKKLVISKERIFVIYLTADGSKEVQDFSLTPEAKSDLGVTENNDGRFIKLNFKFDIVNWLRNIKDEEYIKKEPLLYSAIIQYLDFLEIEFELKDEDKKINDELKGIMKESLDINNLKDLLHTQNEVNKLNSLMLNSIKEKINALCEEKIIGALTKNLKSMGCKVSSYNFEYGYIEIIIEVPQWNH